MAKIQLKRGNDEPISVDVQLGAGDQFMGKVDGVPVEGMFQRIGSGGLLRLGDRIMPFYFTRKNSRIDIWIDGETYSFEVLGAKARSTATASGQIAEEILAPMPGTVLRIEVKAGEIFAAHQPLIIMESMKMEMTLSAPHAGRVAQIGCTVGELVPMGKVLARLKPVSENAELSAQS